MNLNSKIIIFSTLILSLSCAHNEKKQTAEIKTKLSKPSRIQSHLIDAAPPLCRDCIIGSIGDEELLSSGKKIYRLEGADDLRLTNYHFDIPVTYNSSVRKWINYFSTRGKAHYRRYAERAGRYAPVLSKILNDEGMPRDLIYLSMAESGFQNAARSWAKAVGPWQFMPYTGRRFGLEVGFYLDERRDPLKATVAASNYLKVLYGLFGSWELAAAGYNAGEGKVKRAISRYRTKDFWKIARGRYLKPETKNYVPKIMALAIISKNLTHFGFENIEFKKPLDFEEITVPQNSDLFKVAEIMQMDFEAIKRYNPELLRWQTPPKGGEYVIRVPVGKKQAWLKTPADERHVVATDYKTYNLRSTASLKNVGSKFKVNPKVLSDLNGIPGHKRLAPQTQIILPFRSDHTARKNALYADLYEKPRKAVVRRRTYQRWIKRGHNRGEVISNPSKYYVVKSGDTLWDISRKTGVNINTIIRSNYRLVKRRMILPGDKLAIK